VVLRFALLGLLAACSQSLFDNNGGNRDGGTGGEMPVASTCTAPCVGDAAADFDGSPGGANGRWRYLEDLRDRTWVPMTLEQASGVMIGANTNNRIGVCKPGATEHACQALPGALLVSAAGTVAPADPAIELKAPMNQVVQISLKVAMPINADPQVVRLYRNSREDVLFTGTVQPGMTLETSITIDALANERILFALAADTAVQDVGVQLFVSGTGATFPQSCQLAIAFGVAMGNGVDNLCGGDYTFQDYNTGATTPVLAAGPFAEQGMAADITPDKYYEGTNLVMRSGDTTLQFWLRHDMLVPSYSAWPFSDLDLDNTGGIGVVLYDQSGLKLEVNTCTGAGNPLTFAGDRMVYPVDGAWHFVRVVHKAGVVNVCLDGKREFSFAAPAGSLASQFRPHLGRNVVWLPSGAFYDGGLDDVRVFTGALPCE